MASSAAALRVCGSRPGAPPGFGSRRTHRRRALRGRRSCARRASSAAAEDIINVKDETNSKLDTKVDNVAWREANDDLGAAIKTVRDMVSSLRQDVDAQRRKVDETLVTIRHDITAVGTDLEETRARLTSDIDKVRKTSDAAAKVARVAGVATGLVVPHTKPDLSKKVETVHSEVLSAPSAAPASPAKTAEANSSTVEPSAHSAKMSRSAMPATAASGASPSRQAAVTKVADARKRGACDPVLSMHDSAQPRQDAIEAGDLVELRGLLSRPELNGALAAPNEYRADKDRWATELLDTSECLLLKSCNLKLIRKWRDAATNKEAGWEEPDKG